MSANVLNIPSGKLLEIISGKMADWGIPEQNWTITVGSPLTVDTTAGIAQNAAVAMDDTHVICCYSDGEGGPGVAVCLTLDGDAVAAGSLVTFESGFASLISIARMDATHAIVCCRDVSNSSYGTAVCLTLDPATDTISVGTPVIFESASTQATAITRMDDTHAIVAYKDSGNSGFGTAVCLTLSGTSISVGSPTVFESAAVAGGDVDIASLDGTHAIVTYHDEGNGNYGTSVCLTLSGASVSAATPVVFASTYVGASSIARLDANRALVCYSDANDSNDAKAICLSLAGTTITPGTAAFFQSGTVQRIKLHPIVGDQTLVLIRYAAIGASNGGLALVITTTGTSPVEHQYSVFLDGSPPSVYDLYMSAGVLASTEAIVSYYGSARKLTIN